MSLLQIADPTPLVVADMVALGSTELYSSPIAIAYPDGASKRPRSLIELTVSVFGNLTTLALDLTVQAYRCASIDPEQRSAVPAVSTVVASSAGADLGTELITDEDFPDATNWNAVDWTLSTGATHVGLNTTRLSQTIAEITAGGYLHTVDVNTAPQTFLLGAWIYSASLPQERMKLLKVSAMPALPATVIASYLPNVPLLEAADNAQIEYEAAGAVVLDAVSLKKCTPYRQTLIYTDEQLGSGAVFGFLPEGDMAGAYVHAAVRRYQKPL